MAATTPRVGGSPRPTSRKQNESQRLALGDRASACEGEASRTQPMHTRRSQPGPSRDAERGVLKTCELRHRVQIGVVGAVQSRLKLNTKATIPSIRSATIAAPKANADRARFAWSPCPLTSRPRVRAATPATTSDAIGHGPKSIPFVSARVGASQDSRNPPPQSPSSHPHAAPRPEDPAQPRQPHHTHHRLENRRRGATSSVGSNPTPAAYRPANPIVEPSERDDHAPTERR